MRNWIVLALAAAGLLLLSGCGSDHHYELGGSDQPILDQPIKPTQRSAAELWSLWERAQTNEDKVIIEKELLSVIRRSADFGNLEELKNKACSEEVKAEADETLRQCEHAHRAWAEGAKRTPEAQQLEEQKREKEIRLALKESRKQLMQQAGGRLDDKSAEDVKMLIDDWRQEELGGPRWFLRRDEYAEFFGKADFYKAFGQPERKQLISRSGINIFGVPVNCEYYYFYYKCKDGTVQIEVDADSLSKENIVQVSEMNIF